MRTKSISMRQILYRNNKPNSQFKRLFCGECKYLSTKSYTSFSIMRTNNEEEISPNALWIALSRRDWELIDQLFERADVFDLMDDEYNTLPNYFDFLFLACQKNAPLHILQSIHCIYEQLAKTTDFRTLLKWASNGGGSDIVYGFLLDVAPYIHERNIVERKRMNSSSSSHGHIFLQKALLCKRNPYIIKKILCRFPCCIYHAKTNQYGDGETPLELFFHIWEDRLQDIHQKYQHQFQSIPTYDKDFSVIHKVKEILLLLLKANYFNYGKHNTNVQLSLPIHKALRYGGIPTIFLLLLIELMPEECKKQDAEGNFPLHIAVSSFHCGSGYVIPFILRQYPEAASKHNRKNRLPLALYTENVKGKYNDNLQDLVKAAPYALSTIDTSTSLYPYLIALTNDQASISVAIDLLMMDPSIIQYGIPLD